MRKTSFFSFTLLLALIFSLSACSSTAQNGHSSGSDATKKENVNLDDYHKAYFASGCFWCVEAVYESVEGVPEAVSGYSGGKESNPTYEQVGRGLTDHAEAVEVYYDSSKVDFPTLVRVFFGSHDPTTPEPAGSGPRPAIPLHRLLSECCRKSHHRRADQRTGSFRCLQLSHRHRSGGL
jgi:peptide-methionine (S)-S-oxide reductase